MGYLRAVAIVFLLIGSLFPPVAGLNLVIFGAAGCMAFAGMNVLRTLPHLHWVVAFAFILYTPFVISALYLSAPTGYGEEKLGTFFSLTLISTLAVAALRTTRDIERLARVWVIAALLLAIIALAGFSGGRAAGFDSNPIWLARAMGVGVIASAWLAWSNVGRRWWHVLSILTIVAGILATGSRGPSIAVLVGVLVLAFFERGNTFKRIVGISAAALTAWAVIMNHSMFNDSRIRAFLRGDNEVDMSRAHMWQYSVEAAERNPLGVGFGGWAEATSGYGLFEYPHNIFLEITVEHGIFISAIFALLVLIVIVRGLKMAKSAGKSSAVVLATALLLAELVNVSVSGDLNARTFFFVLTLVFWVTAKSGHSALDSKTNLSPVLRFNAFVPTYPKSKNRKRIYS